MRRDTAAHTAEIATHCATQPRCHVGESVVSALASAAPAARSATAHPQLSRLINGARGV